MVFQLNAVGVSEKFFILIFFRLMVNIAKFGVYADPRIIPSPLPETPNREQSLLTLFRMEMEGRVVQNGPTSFSPVISTNVGISPQHFLTFGFNLLTY